MKNNMKTKKTLLRVLSLVVTVLIILCICVMATGCEIPAEAASVNGSYQDTQNTKDAANTIQYNQPTPTDIEYSLERYNLIRRAYWVNGERDKANALPCAIEKPLGYVILLTESGSVVGKFTVDGKVSSLNSFLTPNSEYYEYSRGGEYTSKNSWLADVDGSYGENDNGIFFFTPDGKYVEWTGVYLYSDIPFAVEAPVVNYTEVG